MKRLNVIIVVWILLTASSASAYTQKSIDTLSAEQLIEIVKRYHPVAKQASLQIEKAKAQLVSARGGFDPALRSKIGGKTFGGTEYYNHRGTEVSIPTWFGIEVNAGIERLEGARTNPTETLGRTSYVGVSVPLAKDLLMDKRRAALQTAKVYREASEIERRNILNVLLLDAIKSYWYWTQHYTIYEILDKAVKVNQERLQMIRDAYVLGDRAAIDTSEALTQLQNFEVMREHALMQLQNAGIALSEFLWSADDKPVTLPLHVVPAREPALTSIPGAELPSLEELIESALSSHPELLLYQYKMSALNIEKRLKFQELLPSLKFHYNQLGKGYDVLKTDYTPFFENNYRYGISFSVPLRLSEGRGEYRKTKLTIAETSLEQNLKRLQVENNVRSYYNELATLKRQIVIQEQAYNNFTRLQQAEEIRFQEGEGSLFLINARENKTLESLQKLQELRTKYMVTTSALQAAAGLLVN